MKKALFALVVFIGVSSLGIADNFPVLNGPWFDVLNLRVGFGHTNTMNNPTPVLRPMAGNALRISVPLSCGPTQLFQFSVFARSFNGQLISLPTVFHHGENPVGYASYVYRLNNGIPVAVSDVGVDFNTQSPNGCAIHVEQANLPL